MGAVQFVKYLTSVAAAGSVAAASLAVSPVAALADTSTSADPQSTQSQAGPSGASAGGQGNLGEIVVTANKRQQNISDVGLSITALTGKDLIDENVTSSQDLARVVPAFTVASGADGTPIYTLRGVGFNSANLGAQPTVSVYVDEAALPYGPMTEGPLFDLDRVEVLKGPQGTLFGQNSTAGAINYILAKPTETFTAGVTANFSRFRTIEAEGYVSGPLTDTLKARFAFFGINSDDWQYDYRRASDLGQQRKGALRLLLDWHPVEQLTIATNLNGWMDRSDNQIPQFLVASPRVAAQASPLLFQQPASPMNDRAADWDPDHSFQRYNEFWQAVLRADYAVNDALTLISLSNYNQVKIHSPFDNDGTALTLGYVTTYGDVKAFSQELRMQAKVGDATVTAGANFSHDTSFEGDLQDFGGLLSSTTNTPLGTFYFNRNRGDQTNLSRAGFADAEWTVVPDLTLVSGVRYTELTHTNQACSSDAGDGSFAAAINTLVGAVTGAPGTIPPGGCITLDNTNFTAPLPKQTLQEHNISWRGGLNYKPDANSLYYVLVSRGFKGGNFPIINATSRSQFAPVKQEELTDYEAGLKLSFLERALEFNLSGYYYDYKDKQLLTNTTDPIFGLLPVLANVPKSNVKGFDFDVTARPVTGLTLRAAVALAKSDIENFQGYNAFNMPANLSGKPFNFSPKWTGTADAGYQFPLNDHLNGLVGADMTYNSQTWSDLAQTSSLRIAPYTIFGARAGIASPEGKWSATLWGRNITDRYYWYNAQVGYDSIWRLTGMPATFGITLSKQF